MISARHGYYVFPYELTSEILEQEGIYDSELLRRSAEAVIATAQKRTRVMQIAVGGRFGYQRVGELELDFTLKDGRRI